MENEVQQTKTLLAPLTEIWTDVRCPACVPSGFPSSRLLLRVSGRMETTDAKIQMKCPRCKSTVEWWYGVPQIQIIERGIVKKQKVSFE